MRGTFGLNGLVHLLPIIARQLNPKPLFLPNGLRAPAPKAVRWRYVLSRGSIHDRRNDLAESKAEFDLNSSERRGEPTEDA